MKKKATKKWVAPRNFVAKNQQKSGAGRHVDRKNDYRRHEKHKQKLGE